MQKPSKITVLFAIALGLRLLGLGARSLWWDEGHQWLIASAPSLSEMVDRWWSNPAATHPPLSHLISFGFLRLGDQDWLLRLPSAILGALSVPLLYHLARRYLPSPYALAAAAVLTVSPFHIWFSQEARMYALLCLATLLATICALRLSENPTGARLTAYVSSIALAGYTHAFGLLVLPIHAAWYWTERPNLSKAARRSILAGGILGAILTLPLLAFFAFRAGAPFEGRPFSLAVLPYSLYTFVAGFTLGPTVQELHASRGFDTLLTHAFLITVVLLVGTVLLIEGLLQLRRLPRGGAALLFMGLFVPFVAAILFSLVPGFTYNVRYVSAAFPFFCVVQVLGWRHLRNRGRYRAAAALLATVVITVLSLANLYTAPLHYGQENVRGAVAIWTRERATGQRLFSFRASAPVLHYLSTELRTLHEGLSLDPDERRRQLDASTEMAAPESIWLLVARDFDRSVERELTMNFTITYRRAVEGADLYRLQARR